MNMELTIKVADETKSALEQRARERGYSDVSKYVERLISTDLLAAKSFDEILAPIRQTFQESTVSWKKRLSSTTFSNISFTRATRRMKSTSIWRLKQRPIISSAAIRIYLI